MIRRRKGQKGQALVEMALILPILLLIVMGIIDFGRVYQSYLTVTNAARTAVRQAAVGVSDSIVIQTVKDAASMLDATLLTVTISPPLSQRYPGCSITVEVQYSMPLFTPIIKNILPDPFPVNGKAVMILE